MRLHYMMIISYYSRLYEVALDKRFPPEAGLPGHSMTKGKPIVHVHLLCHSIV